MTTAASFRFAGRVESLDGETLAEARFWVAASSDGGWTGWVFGADADGLLPGRYRMVSHDGWAGEFELAGQASVTRLIETDLLPLTGVGSIPWPVSAEDSNRGPVMAGTPWQSSRGIPPFKQQGDGSRLFPGAR